MSMYRIVFNARNPFWVALSVTIFAVPIPASAQKSAEDSALRGPGTPKPTARNKPPGGPGATPRSGGNPSPPMPQNENSKNIRKEEVSGESASGEATSDINESTEFFYWQSGGTSTWRGSPRNIAYDPSKRGSKGNSYQRNQVGAATNDYSPNGPSNAARGRSAFSIHFGWPYYEFGYLYSVRDGVSIGVTFNSFLGSGFSLFSTIAMATKGTVKFSVSKRGALDIGFRFDLGYIVEIGYKSTAQGFIVDASVLFRYKINYKTSIVPTINVSNRVLFVETSSASSMPISVGMAAEFAPRPRFVLYLRVGIGGGIQTFPKAALGSTGFLYFEATGGLGYAF